MKANLVQFLSPIILLQIVFFFIKNKKTFAAARLLFSFEIYEEHAYSFLSTNDLTLIINDTHARLRYIISLVGN